MDVNQTQMLELGLNAAGFLLGGGIMMVLASIFRRQKRDGEEVIKHSEPVVVTAEKSVPVTTEPGDCQFIDLSGPRPQTERTEKKVTSLGVTRRNRTEVYEVALRMLEAQKSASQVSDELGMSQAEVSLLKARAVQEKGVENVER